MTVYADDLSTLKSIELDEDNLDLCARHFAQLIQDPLEHQALRAALTVLEQRQVDDERFETLGKELQGFETHWKQRILELESRARKVEVSDEQKAAELRTQMAAFQLSYGEFPESAHATLGNILTTLPELEAPWRVTVEAMRQADKLKELGVEVQSRIKTAPTARVSIIWLKRLAGLNKGLGLDSSVVPIFREILEADPGDSDANFALASYYREHQQHFESVKILENFLELVEDEASCLGALRMLCELLDRDLNDLPAAARHYESILEYEPADPGSIEALERHYRVVDDVEGLLGILSRRVQLGRAGDDEITELVHLSMDRLDRPDDAFRWLCEIYSAHPRPYLQTHLTKLAQVVGQEDAAVDTLLRGIDAQRSDAERLSVALSILGFVPKLREVPAQVMELASEAVKDHPSDEIISHYETTLVHFASQKEPRTFLEEMESQAASTLERQCIARVWVAVMDYIPFTPDEWLARAQANVEVLEDDDDALEQLADGLKGRGDDAALAGVYRKRLEADIALKDESWLMDAYQVFLRTQSAESMLALLERWTSMDGASVSAWRWWADESASDCTDLDKLKTALDLLGSEGPSNELVTVCRRLFELVELPERGHFAATLIAVFPSPHPELCPSRFWLISVTYLCESRDYDDALLRLAAQLDVTALEPKFQRELLERSLQFSGLPIGWNQMLLALAVTTESNEHIGALLEDAVNRRCDWVDGYAGAFSSWFKASEDDCRTFINRQESALAQLGWGQHLLDTTNAEDGVRFRCLILELALRTGTEPLKVWSEFLETPEIEVEELEPLFQVSLQRVGEEEAAEAMRDHWIRWLFNHDKYEHALSAAFEEPWPLAAVRRSRRWIWIAKLRWLLQQDTEAAEACQSAMSTGIDREVQWPLVSEVEGWLEGGQERAWTILNAILATAASQLLSEEDDHEKFLSLIRPMSHAAKAEAYRYAAAVFHSYHHDKMWVQAAEFLSVHAREPLEQEQWARRLVGYFEERDEFERIVRLVGVGPLLERDAEDNFPLVRRALEVDRSLASFVLEQTRIWRNRLPEKLNTNLNQLELELSVYYLDDFSNAQRLLSLFERDELESQADWLIDVQVALARGDTAQTIDVSLIQEWARRSIGSNPEALPTRWFDAYEATNARDAEQGITWLLEGGQLGCLTENAASALFRRLNELEEELYEEATRTLLNSALPEVDQRALAGRWLSRAKGLGDWESWRSAWSVLWNQGSLIWHSCEAHLPEPGEAPELLVDLVLEFIASASHFDEPLRARRWALRYLRDLQLQAEQCELIDTFIAEDTFENPADLFSLLALRSRQPGISLKLLDRISELADQEQSWLQAADTFMSVNLEHLVSGIPKSLIPRRAARYYDREKNQEASLHAWGEVIKLEPGDQEATGVSIRLLSELGRFEELWSRLWPGIKFAVQTPEFNERLRVLNEILDRGVSPDGQSAEFLLWRLDTADASSQVLHQTLDWFYERKLWAAFEELCRKALSESRWVKILGKDEHLDLSIRLAEALFFEPAKRPEALGLMTAVREVDIHRAGRCNFLETWISQDLDAAEWILALALELNNDELVAGAYRAIFESLSPIETREEWYQKATEWAVSKKRHDLLVELLTSALELKDSLDPWLLLDWAESFLKGLSADAQIWFWLDDQILTVEPVERRHHWILLRAEQLLKRNVTDPELWNVLHRDESLLRSEARGVELALKSALARDARKDMLLLIERAMDSEAQGALTWESWYEQALARSVEDDWLRIASRALSLDSKISPEVYAKWIDIASHGVMFPEKRALVWLLIEQLKVDGHELEMLITRILGVEDLPFEERLRTFRVSINAGLDNDTLLKCLVDLLRDPNCDEGAVEDALSHWGATADEQDTGLLAAKLKFALIRGLESSGLAGFESVPLEVESFYSRGELKAFSDALINHGSIERGLFWDLAYRQRLAKVNELNVASLLDRVDEVADGLLSSWLSNVLALLEPTARLELCLALARRRRCESFVGSSLRTLLPELQVGCEGWLEVVQLALLNSNELLSSDEEKLLQSYLRLGGRDVRAVLCLAEALSRRADYRRCIDLIEAELAGDWGSDETSLLLALYNVYSRVESAHGMMSTLTRLLRASPADPAIHELLRESVTAETYNEVLTILEETISDELSPSGRGQVELSIGFLARRFGDVEKARKGFDGARGRGLSEALCLDVEHKAHVLNNDLRGVLRVQREYDPSAIDIRRVTEMLTWWLKGVEAGLSLSDRDEGMLVQLLERQGGELGLDGRLVAQLIDLDLYTGLSIYLEGIWLQSFEEPARAENLTGWLEKIALLSSENVPEDPKWWLRRFQAQPPWPEGVALWAERAVAGGRSDDFLELVEAEPDFHAEPYRVRVEVERAKIYLFQREEPEVAADILQFLDDEGMLEGPELHTLFETALLRSGRWEEWRHRLNRQVDALGTDEAKANLFIKAGELLYQQERRPELAEPFFLRALEIRPESPDGLAALAKLYERSGNFFQAISMLERELNATDSETRKVDVLNRMGRIQFEMLGDLTLARTSFEKANALEANDLESLDALRAIASQEGRFEDYHNLLKVSLDSTADVIDYIDISLEAAEVLKNDEPEVVLGILENALKREENNIELRFKQAVVREAIEPNENASIWQTLWPQAGSLLPRERAVVARHLALEYLAAEDYSKVCEFGRLAMEFAEPGEGPIQALISGLTHLELWTEVKSSARGTLDTLSAYPEAKRDSLSELCVWSLAQAHDELDERAEAEHFLKRAILSDKWRNEALAKLIDLFRRTERYSELVIYTRERLDQLLTEETPASTLEVFVEAMGKVGREAEVFSPLLSWALRHPSWELDELLLATAQGRDAKTQVVRHLESRFSENDIGTHRGMLSAGELYEFEFKNEALAVKTYQAVLDANPSNLDALEKLESLLGRRSQWRRLGGVYLELANQLEARGERRRAMFLAKQTVELAQHALRKHDLGLQAAKYLLRFSTLDEADARLAYSVIQASDDLNEERQGLVLLARGGFASKADYESLVKSMGDATEYRDQSRRIAYDFGIQEVSPYESRSDFVTPAISDDEIRKVLAHCLELPLGRFIRELWRVAPETLTRRLPTSYFQGDEVVTSIDGDSFVSCLQKVKRVMGANTLDIRVRPGSVEGPRVLPIQPVTLLLGKESSLVRTDDESARMFCLGRLIALTRPEVIVARLYSGHLLNDVVCGLIDMLGFDTRMVLSKRALAWSEHFAKFGKSRFNNLRSDAETLASQLGLHTFEEYSQRVEEFSLAMGLTVCGDLRGAERGLAWVGDPISSLSTDALRCRLHAFALGDSYSALRRRLWGGP